MPNHFFMGALNKSTLLYEYPKIASKQNSYKCLECDNDVIFKKGNIKQPHFSHKRSNKPCNYYDRPTETQIHKNAKMLIKTLLDNRTLISFHRQCHNCNIKYNILNVDTYSSDSQAIIEYKFNYNNSRKSADVALIENNSIKYIFEICHTNKTKEETRPEPWVEIEAETLIDNINGNSSLNEIDCIRKYECEKCIHEQMEEVKKMNELREIEEKQQREMEEKRRELKRQQIERDILERELIRQQKIRDDMMREEELKLKREQDEKMRIMYEKHKEQIEIQRIRDDELKIIKNEERLKRDADKKEIQRLQYEKYASIGLICKCEKITLRKKCTKINDQNYGKFYFQCRNIPCDKCDFIKWIDNVSEDIEVTMP